MAWAMWLFHGSDPSLSFLTVKGNPEDSGRQQQQPPGGKAAADLRPADESEGMLATLLAATHGAAMECYRVAMIPEQKLEGRRENLIQANELARSCAMLIVAIDRHRGTGGHGGVNPR